MSDGDGEPVDRGERTSDLEEQTTAALTQVTIHLAQLQGRTLALQLGARACIAALRRIDPSEAVVLAGTLVAIREGIETPDGAVPYKQAFEETMAELVEAATTE
ncbi:MAG: hypothetical protein F4Y02_09100 [Chloroflexi bacterium]|nr:hypothetical protein [Chloroflexota bacterium]